ncbi:hypothetical protein ACE3MS_30660 [Paenibacillus dendritiformis]|uniref:hypothetical protein n=1 Tax=Paenibacillus dendritiformis TaxID=130049 RepID=UPI00365B0177
MITIKEYLQETKFVTHQLIQMINNIENHKNQVIHAQEMISLHINDAQIYEKFSRVVWADGAEEEFFDLRERSLEKLRTAGDLQYQLTEIQNLYNNTLLIINSPLQSVAQALLQIAKQGISSEHGKNKNNCSTNLLDAGKMIINKFNVPILDIIWEGRNQSIHYEESNPFPPVRQCFNSLLQNSDDKCQALLGFDQGQNKAYEIVKILDWTDISNFESDLSSLSRT